SSIHDRLFWGRTMILRLQPPKAVPFAHAWLRRRSLATTLFLSSIFSNLCSAQQCAQLSTVSFSENFDTMAASGDNHHSSLMPPNFAFVESGGSGNDEYR